MHDGARIGPYVLESLLAEGGMARVYAARSSESGERVALKLPTLEKSALNDDVVQQVRHEVQAMARLSHPHIVPVLDWGSTPEGQLYLAMPLVEDKSLREIAARVDERGILRLVDQLLDALAYAHDRGVVHRDVKAKNLLIAQRPGAEPHLWLTDFGIASLDLKGPLDHLRMPLGTPTYMSPEQLAGEAKIGPEADLYAVGVLLYLIFEGRRPFPGNTLEEVIASRAREPRPPFTERAIRHVPPGLAAIVHRLLDEDPLSRFPSASALRRELAALRSDGDAVARTGGVCLECGEALPRGAAVCPMCERDVATIIDSAPSPGTFGTHAARQVTALAVRIAPEHRAEVASLLERAGAHVRWASDGLALAAIGVHGSHGGELAQAAELGLAIGSLAGAQVGIAPGTVRMAGSSILELGADRARALADEATPGRVHVEGGLRHAIETSHAIEIREGSFALVGRAALTGRRRMSEARLAPLLAAAKDVADRSHAHAITLVAADGMGKSLALSETIDRLEADGWTCLAAAASGKDPLGAVRDAVRGWAGVWPGASRAEASRTIANRLIDSLDAGPVFRPAGTTPGFAPGAPKARRSKDSAREIEARLGDEAIASSVAAVLAEPAQGELPPGARARALDVIGAMFARASDGAPVLFAIDDVASLDGASRELAALIVERLADRPVLIVVTARPDDEPLERSSVIELPPLSEEDADALLSMNAVAAKANRARMLRLAGGHPARLLELARLERSNVTLGTLPAQATIDDIVRARIASLAEDERALVELAAVLGRTTWSAQLMEIADPPELRARVPELLQKLVERELFEWVEPSSILGTRELRFTNEALREAALAVVEPDRAERVHGQAARWLERHAAHLGGPVLDAIASHWERAGVIARSAAWEVRAGRRAEALGSIGDALERYRRALAKLDRDGEVRSSFAADGSPFPVDVPGLLAAICRVAVASGEKEIARRAAERALSVEEPARALVRGQARAALAEIARMEGEPERSITFIDAALAELRDGDRILRAQLLGRRGWILGYVLGRNDEGREDSERALALLDGLDVPAIESHIYSELGANELRAGRWDRQLECNRRALELAQRAEELYGQARAHINLSVCYTNRGDLARAAEHAISAASMGLRTGLHRARIIALNNLGIVRLDQRELAEARRLLLMVLELCARHGIKDILHETLPMLGRVLCEEGDHEGALARAREGADIALREGNTVGVALAWRVMALVHARKGERDRARRALGRSDDALGPGGDAYERAVTQLARALLDGTDRTAARAELTRLGADPDLEERRWKP